MSRLSMRGIAEGTIKKMRRAERALMKLRPEVETLQFLAMHRANPHLFINFRRLALEARRADRDYYSAKDIVSRLRWWTDVETHGRYRGGFKINNNASSYYARLFVLYDPSFDEFFRMRGHGVPVTRKARRGRKRRRK